MAIGTKPEWKSVREEVLSHLDSAAGAVVATNDGNGNIDVVGFADYDGDRPGGQDRTEREVVKSAAHFVGQRKGPIPGLMASPPDYSATSELDGTREDVREAIRSTEHAVVITLNDSDIEWGRDEGAGYGGGNFTSRDDGSALKPCMAALDGRFSESGAPDPSGGRDPLGGLLG